MTLGKYGKVMLGLILLFFVTNCKSYAQLPDGTTVPDFTFTDINGGAHNLYSYLNAGKYVALEVSATWCHPCWLYHTSGSMESMYNLHDTPGDQTWKVLFVEGDGSTSLADLQGTGTSTQGDWVTGTSFPIMNPTGVTLNDFKTSYDINSFPTLYLICPNKKIYQDTINKSPRGLVATWAYAAATFCGPVGLDNMKDANPLTIYPNPARDYVGIYFSLNNATEVKLSVTNIVGQAICNKNFGYLQAGDHSLRYEISELTEGIYYFTISDGNNRLVRKKVVVQ
jgi:hypothetical protein